MTKSMPFYPLSVISLNDYKAFVTFETVTIFLAKTWILIQLDNLVIQHCSIKTLSLTVVATNMVIVTDFIIMIISHKVPASNTFKSASTYEPTVSKVL